MIDNKINQLINICEKIPYVEYYSHENSRMYKIENIYTDYNKDILVLCRVDEGFEKALDLAIKHITEKKKIFFGE